MSGPMTGYDQFNYPAFADAALRLRRAGYEVTSPHETDARLLVPGFDPADPSTLTADGYRALLREDVDLILSGDVTGVATLANWERSSGALLEVRAARTIGRAVHAVGAWVALALP